MQASLNEQKHALVIGVNGGIGAQVVKQLVANGQYATIFTLSRGQLNQDFTFNGSNTNVVHKAMDTANEAQVKDFVQGLKTNNVKLSLVICTTGILHQQSTEGEDTLMLKPEKRLEDMREQQLAEYFRINSILPAIWLQHLVNVVDRKSANIIFFSARVGSISENALGGWYGYRASKAALNMLVKTAAIEYKRRMPNTSLVCYHPGTVDTELSKPFQANVKPGKLFTTEFTVTQLLNICHDLDAEHSPYYLDWKGDTIAW